MLCQILAGWVVGEACGCECYRDCSGFQLWAQHIWSRARQCTFLWSHPSREMLGALAFGSSTSAYSAERHLQPPHSSSEFLLSVWFQGRPWEQTTVAWAAEEGAVLDLWSQSPQQHCSVRKAAGQSHIRRTTGKTQQTPSSLSSQDSLRRVIANLTWWTEDQTSGGKCVKCLQTQTWGSKKNESAPVSSYKKWWRLLENPRIYYRKKKESILKSLALKKMHVRWIHFGQKIC